jgi:hypothetical protein
MVDGVTVRKSLVRQTLKTENVSGTYVGAASTIQACSDPTLNGEFLQPVRVTLVHSGSSFQMSTTDVDTGRQCAWAGTYIQDGQVARAGGDYSCTSGEIGTFNFFEIQSSISGIMGRLSTVSTISGTTCNIDGRLAAVQTATVDLPSLKNCSSGELELGGLLRAGWVLNATDSRRRYGRRREWPTLVRGCLPPFALTQSCVNPPE